MDYIKRRIINMQNSIHACRMWIDSQITAIWFLNKTVSLHVKNMNKRKLFIEHDNKHIFASNNCSDHQHHFLLLLFGPVGGTIGFSTNKTKINEMLFYFCTSLLKLCLSKYDKRRTVNE